MHVTVFFRDAIQDALEIVRKQFPGHEVLGITERVRMQFPRQAEKMGIKELADEIATKKGWTGYYENWPHRWEFHLQKRDAAAPGPSRAWAELHPMFDVIFKGMEVVDVLIHFDGEKRLYSVEGIESSLLDLAVTYDTDEMGAPGE
jgi:hypothetical protein